MSLDAFLQGVIAGYGIAIPIGPIGIIILELGTRRGFRVAFSAGLGTASADLIYATIASVAGTFLAQILAPFALLIRLASAGALIALGAWLFYHGVRASRSTEPSRFASGNCLNTYCLLLGLTLLNPVTVTYFTSLILGLRMSVASLGVDVPFFIAGAFLASLSWQSLLACIGGYAHQRLSARLQAATFAVGNAVIIVLGIAIFLGFHI